MHTLGIFLLGWTFGQPPMAGDAEAFTRSLIELQQQHRLKPLARYDSKRFLVLSNAKEDLTRQQVRYCEIFTDIFLHHFRSKGFELQFPSQRLQVILFDTPIGFEAYLGRRMPAGVTGVYHRPSNRLVLYDLAQNQQILLAREQGLKNLAPQDRLFQTQTVERRYHDLAHDFNLGTTMHECAHHLSFNCGLLNRQADCPLWLAEGLACYCEATNEGDWQSLGSINPMRVAELAKYRGDYFSIAKLIGDDEWIGSPRVLLGYAQSWALFRFLMQTRPLALKEYLHAVNQRHSPEARLADFRHVFGSDLGQFERQYNAYLDEMAQKYVPRKAR